MKPGKTGISRIIDATGYSMKGLRATWVSEAAFRQEVLLAVVLLPLSFWLATTPVQWVILVAPLMLMLIVELLNSAVEAVVDRISDAHHELSGRAKDMGSAAVLLSLILLASSWGAIAWERFHGFA
ncbi:diacylglycerol kinase [Marinihelvus fidelis]|uniref:Diacylglycerol kinase n=1 Tax=Marinihelvus fidelis TaxID=2613842 RepID=A0A5N0T7Q6_9GAMM|nr:diacylglycerol kinase [Marinihelvus fidelis]KAA9130932.1 diacylglycerol kinase [Marinihelvus fidelis]